MRPFWISWWGEDVAFTLESPWWISGYREIERDGSVFDQPSMCAAVMAEDERGAKAVVSAAHDNPVNPEFRFCQERPADWAPFCDRFPRADWMRWGT